MKTVSPTLAALINGGIFQFAHVYTISLFGTLGSQSQILLTDADMDVGVQTLPTDSNLLCLMHFSGANGSTQFLDSTGRHTFAIQTGSPVLDTSTYEFLPSSFFTNGGAAQIVSDGGVANADFQFNSATDFTVDFWANIANTAIQNNLLTLDGSSGSQVIYWNSAGNLRWFDASDQIVGGAGGITNNTWHHIALVRHSNVLTLYIDGVSQGTHNDAGKSYTGILGPGGNFQFQGHLDEIRVKNVALWTANFTPPTSALGFLTYSSKTIQVDQRANQRLAHWKRGLDVDTAVVVLAPRTTDPTTGVSFPDTIGSVPFLEAARGGALDGADVQIDRVFFNSWPQPPFKSPITAVGSFTLFAGTPAEVDVNDTLVILTLNDYRQLLTNKYPRVVYQLGCTNTLFDAGCTLNPASFSVTGIVVAAGSTRQQVIATASVTAPVSPGSGTFTLGKITFTSGRNSGFSRTVRMWSGGTTFQLLTPLPFTPAPGDVFTAFEGCDKQQTTCSAFSNLVNFGGQPFIPDATNAA